MLESVMALFTVATVTKRAYSNVSRQRTWLPFGTVLYSIVHRLCISPEFQYFPRPPQNGRRRPSPHFDGYGGWYRTPLLDSWKGSEAVIPARGYGCRRTLAQGTMSGKRKGTAQSGGPLTCRHVVHALALNRIWRASVRGDRVSLVL